MLPGVLIGSSPIIAIVFKTSARVAIMLVFNETMEVVCIVTMEALSAAVGAIITLLVIVYKIVLEIFNTASEKRDLSNARTNALNILKMYLNATPLVENWTAVALFFLSATESGAEEELDSEVIP